MSKFDSFTIEPNLYGGGGVAVYGHGVYEESSVLAGQARRVFIESYDTAEQARAAYPRADVLEHSTRVHSDDDDLETISGLPESPPDWFAPLDAGESW